MQIDVKGLDNLQIKLNQFKNDLTHAEPLMAKLANHLHVMVEVSFEREQSPDGKKWTPIKPNKKDPHPKKILWSSGAMQGSLYRNVTKDTAIVGLNAISPSGFQYPLTHQFGTSNAWGKGITVPARPFLPIDSKGYIYEGVEKELMEIVDDYVELMSFKIN